MMSVKPSTALALNRCQSLSLLDRNWGYLRLLGTRKQSYFNGGNWIADFLKGESEFQLRGERFGARIIDNIEVGDDAENPLLHLRLDLLGGDLLGGIIHIDRGLHLSGCVSVLSSSISLTTQTSATLTTT